MSNDFEEQLRAALRPIEPRDGFADRVTARLETESNAPIDLALRRTARSRLVFARWIPAALAASAVFSFAIVHYAREREEQRGMEARRQLIEALRVTSGKLDAVFQVVNSKPAASGDDPGA